MGKTKIEWTVSPAGIPGYTFSPWFGCTKVSPGCDHCYAEGWAKRSGVVKWNAAPRRASEAYWRQPRTWNAEAVRTGVRSRVFCASLSDVFDNQVPAEWRHELWEVIAECQSLDWLLLTKRPQNVAAMLPPGWDSGWPHVSLGVTAENQHEADRRIPILLATPAARRFVSCEPLLGPVDLADIRWPADRPRFPDTDDLSDARTALRLIDGTRLDWVICGGESGPGARPMHPDWARGLRDQCARADVPFFFKQWGEWLSSDQQGAGETPSRERRHLDVDGQECHGSQANAVMHRVGKHTAGALLDGRAHREMPA